MIILPGVQREYVLRRLESGAGGEIASGKIESDQSSAALAVNCLGYFVDRISELPPFPGVAIDDWPPKQLELEYVARFPWNGGRHPHLDACVFSKKHLLGIESKRYEPFRDRKRSQFSDAYDRPVWGDEMEGFNVVKNATKEKKLEFEYLDAVQLVKHAYGLRTEGQRLKKKASLLYLFAEPASLNGKPISSDQKAAHREEIRAFADLVNGSEVSFASISYREWLEQWEFPLRDHRQAVLDTFRP